MSRTIFIACCGLFAVVTLLTACFPGESIERQPFENYLLEIDLNIDCPWSIIRLTYEIPGDSNPGITVERKSTPAQNALHDHVSLQEAKTVRLVMRSMFKERSELKDVAPGHFRLSIDGADKGVFLPIKTEYPSLLKYDVSCKCKRM